MPKKKEEKLTRGHYIFIGILAAIVIGIGVGVYAYIQNPPETSKFGAVGSTHIHSIMLIMADGKQVIDFSQDDYQLKSPYIHFEYKNGYKVHMHATNVNLGYLFKTLGMEFNSNCLKLNDDMSYCNNGNKTLKFYVNGERNYEYDKYVFKDLDKLLISYGDEDEMQINRELEVLDGIFNEYITKP
ncbi:MAG: hypothetical protein QW416_07330 [Candidatus Nitrosocaldaceae archaeon]